MFDYISELGVTDETVSFFLAIFIGTFTISLLIGLALYLLESIGVYKMAKARKLKTHGFRLYLSAETGYSVRLPKNTKRKTE